MKIHLPIHFPSLIKNNKNKLLVCVYITLIFCGMIKSYFYDIKTAVAPSTNRHSIILDSGHGGWDPGKVVGNTNEKDINLLISQKLQAYLEQSGSLVTPTRTGDEALSKSKREDLKERVKLTSDGEMLISIHQNYFPKASVRGAQVFYYTNSEESKKLAELIQERLKELDGTNTRIAKANSEYYLLKQTKIPAVIIECGFLSNENEREKLETDEYQSKVAWAIYLGILDYYGQEI